MDSSDNPKDVMPPSLKVIPTIYPTSVSLEDELERFWDVGDELKDVEIPIDPPVESLALLGQLGPSPFERGSFPLIGFLATTYDKVSRYAQERA